MSFPEDFTWGAAAASYQIEGAAYEDGKGLSVWDMFSRWEGKTNKGQTGEVACDHYHQYKKDVALMKEIGLQAYRLSVSWPRVIPEGTGKINPKGIEFYDKLIDELLAAGIEPWVTLFHWDYPYALFLKGGWLNPESPEWFADYAKALVDKLSDRVSHWMTLNEPQCFIGLGHQNGNHAPGLKLDLPEILTACHNTLLSHGKAVKVIRANAKKEPAIGWAPCGSAAFPATESEEDVNAAREFMFTFTEKTIWKDCWWNDPVYLGRYPESGLEQMGKDMPKIKDGDMETINQPLDFIGVNIYSGPAVKSTENGPEKLEFEEGHPKTLFHWPMAPKSLQWGPKFLYERYKLPVAVTENGLSGMDWVALDGKVHDPGRIDFLKRYLREFRKAGEDGVDLKGYFQWSIMDNYEWAEGYKHRFGLVHVNYQTLERTIKDSGGWYKKVIETNGKALDE